MGVDTETVLPGPSELFSDAPGPHPRGPAGLAKRPPKPDDDPDRAPHGWTYRDGAWTPRKPAGRPAKPRVDMPAAATIPAPPPTPPAAKKVKNYRPVIEETLQAGWFVGGMAPLPDAVFGVDLKPWRMRLRVQAGLIEAHAEELVGGLQTLAEHQPFVAKRLDALSRGEGGLWVLQAVMLLGPFVQASAAVWSHPVSEELELAAKQVEQRAIEYLSRTMMAANVQEVPVTAPAETG